jgi:murein DD-endopeptidase MepM/ murein hydrolase activator NlpD
MRFALLLALPFLLTAAERPALPDIGYPLAEVKPGELRSMFKDRRTGHRHEAIDLMRPRGTEIMAVTDGVIRKLFRSRTGGISIYLFDGTEEFCFFYAHLDHYAKGLHEGQEVRKGEIIGYVGYTGNAPRNAPHLHFAVSLTGPERRWSGGVAIDPYPMLLTAVPPTPIDTNATVVSDDKQH